MTKMTSREQFEAWFEEWFGDKPLSGWSELWCGDGYSSETIDEMWESWQASRSSIELNLTSEWDISSDGSRHYDADSVDEQLLSLGIKVKK